MKTFISVLVLFIIISCKNNSEVKHEPNNESTKIITKEELEPYFKFDKIEYYHLNITDDEWNRLVNKKKRTSDEENLLAILNLKNPEIIDEKQFIKNVNKLYPHKSEIKKIDLNKIRNIFSDKYSEYYENTACIPYYRDILIFSNKNNVTGIAKICFDCNLSNIIGTNKNTEMFGQNGDFRQLKNILKNYLPISVH